MNILVAAHWNKTISPLWRETIPSTEVKLLAFGSDAFTSHQIYKRSNPALCKRDHKEGIGKMGLFIFSLKVKKRDIIMTM